MNAKQCTGSRSMIATGNPLAAAAANAMLQAGGSAVDAAIAADAVLGVVEPMATSIGGDLLATLCLPDGQVVCYNGTGRAPAAMDPSALDDFPGRRIPERHPWSVTTPGAVRGWADLHARYGKLDWRCLFNPAIGYARDGFAVAAVAAQEWAIFDFVLKRDPVCAQLFRAGNSPQAGDHVANPQLARVLEMIAQEGADAFYESWVAQRAAQAVQRAGGLLDAADFQKHTGDFCEPVKTLFNGFMVHQCPPNTHGIAILDALQRIQEDNLDPADPLAHVSMVKATEHAMRRASQTVADPSGNTVCSVIVDEQGLAITLMSSIFKRFGSGIAVPDGGFVLQNRGFGFAEPGHVNGPAPNKRPYHTVVPGMSTLDGRFHLGMGVVGGLMQPQGQVQILTRVLSWGNALSDSVSTPRWRLEAGNTLAIEAGMDVCVEQALRDAGYQQPAKSAGELAGRSDFGGAHAVMRMPDGSLLGVADKRKDGQALGY
ncbi:gamma-glutamyltransferase family protein [Advenella mimigardefordensis]|uniref:Putative gamma-glutamyltransferase n=1 Tax=Advenella mimigardefordensis (strain DSM 17166 / LMG 22922 / DPN7) TaxID=1247726 RepID=W0PK96_ADVMD|nr:gamma-glutamyltransferase [Advenella mimigardefordensis]AHG65413.1 putative gamma-glutamyltransferase [Advenella mimigardefordensis DPN7]